MALGIAAFTGGIIATVFAVVLRNSRGPMIGPKAMMRLASCGRPAVATVQTVSPTAMRTGLDRWVVLSLQVQPDDDSPPYDASITALLPWWVMARPGQRYPAAADPSDPHRVALLFTPPSLPEAPGPR